MPLQTSDSTPDEKPGRSIDDGKGRIFPCDRCGADLVFSIGQQSLQCPYCGEVQRLEHHNDIPIVERDYLKMLAQLQRQRDSSPSEDDEPTTQHAVRCDSCGAEVVFQGNLTSSQCPYCACPLQRDKVHDSVSRIPVDGMLPFLIPAEQAAENLRAWVKSLWWAPNEFLKQGANGKFNGVYLPFFTFDALAYTQYAGRRGDAYFITVGEGNNRRTERRVNWTSAGGEFEQFFDDVLIIAAIEQRPDLVRSLEPWPLDSLIPFTPEVLAGFFSRTYDIALEDGFHHARQLIEQALAESARKRIGGGRAASHVVECELLPDHLQAPAASRLADGVSLSERNVSSHDERHDWCGLGATTVQRRENHFCHHSRHPRGARSLGTVGFIR